MPDPTSAETHVILLKRTDDGRYWRDILRFITGGYWIDQQHWLRGGTSLTVPVNPEASSQPIILPRSAILHSNAGPRKTPWAALIAFWRRQDITGEAHFQVDGVDALHLADARIVQAIPFNRRADCNAKANSWWRNSRRVGAISFETQDRGSPTLATTPWSMAQLHAMIGALTCLCVVYGVACTQPATWDDSGIGHHNLHKEWSIYKGKTCPGAARIRQMDYIRSQVTQNLAAFADVTGWKCGTGRA